MNQSLYQINTKVLLSQLAPHATLDQIPDGLLDHLESIGVDWVWLLGVWQIGPEGKRISCEHTEWHAEYRRALPGLQEEDICGSPFAVASYSVAPELGGSSALVRFRQRLSKRGMKLLLDFVPNHVGFDHAWVRNQPSFCIAGSEDDLRSNPDCWKRLEDGRIVAYGRDPYFPGWPDTAQLNYFNPELRRLVVEELKRVASLCDGVRCDMAMLLEPEVFEKTWGGRNGSFPASIPYFWPEAIEQTKAVHPDFIFMAEVYWNYEEKLQAHGFDYTYDKTLYDRLIEGQASAVRSHLQAPLSYQRKMVRFLENHDEPRIASRVRFDQARGMALVTYLAPGMRFFHHGQFTGSTIRVPVHLRRGPTEELDSQTEAFYQKLLPLVDSSLVRSGEWQLVSCLPAWNGNPTDSNFIAYAITHEDTMLLLVVNLAPYRSQCRIAIPGHLLGGERVLLHDILGSAFYERSRMELQEAGLFVDVGSYGAHVFIAEI